MMTEHKAFSVFISYAHRDNEDSDPNKRWLDRLLQFLHPLVEQNQVQAWSDTEIEAGEEWEGMIRAALESARAAVLLVSPAFLASKYIRNSELPVLLKNARDRGAVIIPVILRHSLFDEVKFKHPDPKDGPHEFSLSSLQAANSPGKPLNSMTESEQDQVLLSIAQRILRIARQASPPPERLQEVGPEPPANTRPAEGGRPPLNDSSQAVDNRALREILLASFDLQELAELCWEVQEDLAKDGIDLQVNLEIVGGQGKRGQVLNLIQYLDRRNYLPYLVKNVRKSRPNLI